VALVADAKRDLLLRVHSHRLRREDLEDAYGQATFELIVLARSGRGFASRRHIANALEQRFLARVVDRRRAIGGRSPITAALEGAVPFAAAGGEELELPDTRQAPERVAVARDELKRLLAHLGALTPDQRAVLGTQLATGMRCEEFCALYGWTPEKYRKVAQRGRGRLRELLAAQDSRAGDVPGAMEGSDQKAGTAYENHSPHS
jgi:DNA-directed RNA polymerase specialized sigma24 family protein